MRRTFNLFFTRPENIFDWELTVPDQWDEWEEDYKLEWLTDKVEMYGRRFLEVEEYDESD